MTIKSLDIPQDQINSIIELYSSGHIKEALNDTESLIIKYPDESLLFNISGVCYKAIGQLQDAIRVRRGRAVLHGGGDAP